jgi:anti-sigma28 factor (negative regulator of flagellin synthesis)
MSLCVQPGQREVDLSSGSSFSAALSGSKSGSAHSGSSPVASAECDPSALEGAQDSASISVAPGQLSGDLPNRQDRLDALRAQIEAGIYTVNPHTVASAMSQNLFRS